MKKLIYKGDELQDALLCAMKKYNEYYWVSYYVSAGDAPYFQFLKENQDKIKKFYIHGLQRHKNKLFDEFYTEFKKHPNVHFVTGFWPNYMCSVHSKFYFFYNSASDWCGIMGSFNLTKRAFNNNHECAVYIDADSDPQNQYIESVFEMFESYLPNCEYLKDTNHIKTEL